MLKNFEILQSWFYENHMVLNPGKFYYLIINKDIANESIELGMKTLHFHNSISAPLRVCLCLNSP